MNEMYNVSVSPHLRSETGTNSIMRDVAIALLPACLFGIYNFGYRALLVILVSVLAAVVTEFVYEKLVKRPVTIGDWSAVVTGMILAVNLPATLPLWMAALGSVFAILVVKQLFGGLGQNFMNPALAGRGMILAVNLPATLPLWMAALGSVFAILVVKQLFGGLGQNFMNPALAGRCFLLISFGSQMTAFPVVDGISAATPLSAMKAGESVDLLQMFIGNYSGCIGETSVLAILLGAGYLLYKKVISIRIPGIYILSTMVFIVILNLVTGSGMPTGSYLLAHLFGGGLLIGSFFMATDYVTSPITPMGQVIYALLIGFLTALFRVVGKSAEGVSYAIIISNMAVPLIEKATVPTPFGRKKGKGGAKA